ncbi:MAG TPA: UpxY family transcription antiterminator, partial [Terriglobales bacterium]|nr:UpxY family transcription antiterminator [Terriglobales bacterium]
MERAVLQPSALPQGGLDPLFSPTAIWYAAYTCPRHEKRIAAQLREKQLACFLPVYQTIHQWKDRYKQLELPLFPGYVFVSIEQKDRLRVLQLPGVVRFVTFNGALAQIDPSELEALRSILDRNGDVQPHPYLTVGRKVRILRGSLSGIGFKFSGSTHYKRSVAENR